MFLQGKGKRKCRNNDRIESQLLIAIETKHHIVPPYFVYHIIIYFASCFVNFEDIVIVQNFANKEQKLYDE